MKKKIMEVSLNYMYIFNSRAESLKVYLPDKRRRSLQGIKPHQVS